MYGNTKHTPLEVNTTAIDCTTACVDVQPMQLGGYSKYGT